MTFDKMASAVNFPMAYLSHNVITIHTQWLSGRLLDSRPRGRGLEPHRRHCVVVIYPSLLLVQPRKTRPCLTERLLMGRKESIKQTNNHTQHFYKQKTSVK